MALYNTDADAANTAVRAFLTQIGEYYLKRNFNTGAGKAKKDWERIRDEIFSGKCAYCGKKGEKLQMEHIVMFNRSEFGLHHPGNIIPVCKECNSRSKKNESGIYNNWEEHLSYICESKNQKNEFYDRWKKIKNHISEGEYAYPQLSEEEKKAILIISNNLYDCIKNEFENAIKLYKELNQAFTHQKFN
jgi:hypothetical protein